MLFLLLSEYEVMGYLQFVNARKACSIDQLAWLSTRNAKHYDDTFLEANSNLPPSAREGPPKWQPPPGLV